MCGLSKDVNSDCDMILGDNIDIMEDINVDRDMVVVSKNIKVGQ